MKLSKNVIKKVISSALAEDIGSGDITTNSIIKKDVNAKACFIAKEDGVVAGLEIAKMVFTEFGGKIIWKSFVKDGEHVKKGTVIAEAIANLRTLLSCERTALNLLQRMSGIASSSSKYARAIKGTKTLVLDTRKTAPGLRMLDKYAVKIGGAENHRIGLYDMVLIKDNHIKAAGSITNAVELVRKKIKKKTLIEVETSNLDEVKEALECKADIIMLDNMHQLDMKIAVKLINKRAKVEASGNITIDNIRMIANTGVDYISVGALTHSVKALDISMKIFN